jgi:hypothetical protein
MRNVSSRGEGIKLRLMYRLSERVKQTTLKISVLSHFDQVPVRRLIRKTEMSYATGKHQDYNGFACSYKILLQQL